MRNTVVFGKSAKYLWSSFQKNSWYNYSIWMDVCFSLPCSRKCYLTFTN